MNSDRPPMVDVLVQLDKQATWIERLQLRIDELERTVARLRDRAADREISELQPQRTARRVVLRQQEAPQMLSLATKRLTASLAHIEARLSKGDPEPEPDDT